MLFLRNGLSPQKQSYPMFPSLKHPGVCINRRKKEKEEERKQREGGTEGGKDIIY